MDVHVLADGHRDFNDPKRGVATYRQVTLHPVEQEHTKLVLLRPAG